MEDDLGPAYGRVHALIRAQVAFDEMDISLELGEVRATPGREVVEHADLVASREQRTHDVRADEPTTARHERLHRGTSATTWKFA